MLNYEMNTLQNQKDEIKVLREINDNLLKIDKKLESLCNIQNAQKDKTEETIDS